MRHIQVEDGLRLRFPGRDASFQEGVEIGLLVAQLAQQGGRSFTRLLSSASLDQARSVARGFGCAIEVVAEQDGVSEVVVSSGRRRPVLTVVPGGLRTA
ncbi:hypothetical protein M446_3630 [Methylobacterium sp. 4-46]|uniref:hypothetical protein n=1 Tax=unclassified Methylobacterium TaxID=2615210 RepID=UPI000152D40C|nr:MULTISPECIES: hypothetical protein [Methylobacterium]ACA18011.1 hypothetical protein M446_3630 [Methylobacterium sp. 4-46]WFT77312.1 hypothetical protein QA634_18395 [Methylobacterium nodulans]